MTQARQLMQDLSQRSLIEALKANAQHIVHTDRLAEVGTVIKMQDYSAVLVKVNQDDIELVEGTWEFTPPGEAGMDLCHHATDLRGGKHA